MLRSLAAVIIAVIVGLSTTKMIEGGGAALFGVGAKTTSYAALLLGGWLGGAFLAALVALIIGKRWAPLGALGAGAIFIGAVITLVSYPLSWLLWPGALMATILGGLGAMRLLGAKMQYPELAKKDGLFDA